MASCPTHLAGAASKLHNFRLIPLPSSHTLVRYDNHLLVISRELRQSHSLTKTRYGGRAPRGRGRHGGNDNSDSDKNEEIK